MTAWCAVLLLLVGIVNAWPTEAPFWPYYPMRSLQVLDGEWEFGYEESWKYDVTSNTTDVSNVVTPNTTMVPSVFDYRPPGYEGPRGTAFYRTEVNITSGNASLIYFAACGFYCHVFVDGQSIGDHRAGGYAPFWLTIPPSKKETRELFVIADNRWNSTTAPVHTGGDFYAFGGIHRSVIIHELPNPELYLERVEVFTKDFSTGTVDLNVVLSGNYNGKVVVKLVWDAQSGSSVSGTAQNGIVTFSQLQVPNAKPWTLATPNLHNLTVTLLDSDSNPSDAIQVRFGLRVLEIDSGRRITVNGERVKLHGFNRHTMFPDVGPAMTTDQIWGDVKLLQGIGANYVRGAHYPQDQRFLDICDEVGIVIWEEALGPGVTTSDTESAYFMQHQVQQMNEMISASINHPSIFFWGFFNEGPADSNSSCPGYQTMAETAHARDTTRFVTWADNSLLNDKCLKYADVISFNSYPGWYSDSGNSSAPISAWSSVIDQAAQEYQQPITISETGCEGLWEWANNASSVIWGQPYQVLTLGNDIKTILGHDRVTGITLWVMNDFKANDGAQSTCGPCPYIPGTNNASYVNYQCNGSCGLSCRPCGENHKGTFDYWRRPKLVYDEVKSLYSQQWP